MNSSMTQAASVKARCWMKAPSEPLSSGATGGAFRRSCLSGRSPRVLRRPPVVSSAGQSSDQAQLEQTAGSAGSPFLPTSLATQRSRAPAGRRRGSAKRRFAPPKPAGCANPAVESRPGQCDAKQRNAAGLHQRITKHSNRFSRTHPADVGLRCANPTYDTAGLRPRNVSRARRNTLRRAAG